MVGYTRFHVCGRNSGPAGVSPYGAIRFGPDADPLMTRKEAAEHYAGLPVVAFVRATEDAFGVPVCDWRRGALVGISVRGER